MDVAFRKRSEYVIEYVTKLYRDHFEPEIANKLLSDLIQAQAIFHKHGQSIFNPPMSPDAQRLMDQLMGYPDNDDEAIK